MPTLLKISQILQELEQLAPSGTAESWDNVGLLVGDPSWQTASAVVEVDLTRAAVELARQKKSKLILIHHPCIFPRGRGPSKLVQGAPDEISSLMLDCIRHEIAVVSLHTNFDRCALEVVQGVSQALEVIPRGRLYERSESSLLVKLVVFVPRTHLEAVREAVCLAGAGHVGNYDSCTFGSAGEGTFRGLEGTQPFLGKPGVLEKAQEVRLETVFPRGLLQPVLRALFQAHPYEEVAYDLVSVEQKPSEEGYIKGLGYGFWGEFSSSPSFSELSERVRKAFNIKGFMISGTVPKKIKRIAFAAGKGSSVLSHASSLECDLMITGEAGYHDALTQARSGMAVIELGHRQSEAFFPKVISKWLTSEPLSLKVFQSDSPIQRFIC